MDSNLVLQSNIIFFSENFTMCLFNPRGFSQLLSITDTFEGGEAVFKLADFFCPFASLYARAHLLGEKNKFEVIEAGIHYLIEKDCITVRKDELTYFEFKSKEVLSSIIDTFNNTAIFDLMKQGDLANFKAKKTTVDFLDQLIGYYFDQAITIPTFCSRIKSIMLGEKQLNTKCNLVKIFNKFAKNVIEPSSFEQLIKLFILKLIASFSSSKHQENIEQFIKNYELN